MASYNLLGDWAPYDMIPDKTAHMGGHFSFSDLVTAYIRGEHQKLHAQLDAFLSAAANYLVIDLQASVIMTDPEHSDDPDIRTDPLTLGNAYWKEFIHKLTDEILKYYVPEQVIINQHFAPTQVLTDKGLVNYDNSMRIRQYNSLINFFIKYLLRAFDGCHMISFPEQVIDVACVRGKQQEFQLHPTYYRYGRAAFSLIFSDVREETEQLEILCDQYSQIFEAYQVKPELAELEDMNERQRIVGFWLNVRGYDSLTLAWNPGPYASGYVIEQYLEHKWKEIVVIEDPHVTHYKVEHLKAGVRAHFRIRVSDAPDAPFTSYLYLHAITAPAPTAGAAVPAEDGGLLFSWEKAEGAEGYILEVNRNDKWTRLARIGEADQLSHEAPGIVYNDNTQFRIQTFAFNNKTPMYTISPVFTVTKKGL